MSFIRMMVLVGLAFPVCSSASAALFGPGAEPPDVIGNVFTWSRGDANSTYSGWDRWEGVADVTSSPFVDSTPDILQIGTASSIGVGPGYIPTASGNIYSPFAALNYTATAASGTSGGNFTRIVAQMRMSGGRVDPPGDSLDPAGDRLDVDSLLMTVNGQDQAPDLLIQTLGLPPGSPFSTEPGTDYLAVWDIDGSAVGYDFAFGSAVSSVALEEFHIDTFVQDVAFASVSAVPEPGSLGMILTAAGTWVVTRRRRRRVAVP